MKKILIVDDSKLNLMVMSDILTKEGFTVKCLDSSLNIVSEVITIKPDVIMLDLVMLKVDGFKVCELLKEETRTSSIPIIMVTADTNPSSIKKALDLGAFDYIKKPFEDIEVLARVSSAIRITEYENKLRRLALKDSLTCLYNRKAFMELFGRELSNQVRQQFGLSFLMIDIDDFKKINDSYGHQCGDFILRELALLLVSSVRECDIVSRYGGEEFCILLSNITKEDSFKVCQRLITTVSNHQFIYSNNYIKVTVSIGALFNDFTSKLDRDSVIKIADDNLYFVKNSGKNSVKLE